MIFSGKIQKVLWLWSTGALLPVAAQQPQAPSIPIEVPKRGNPGVPEHVLQMQEMLQSMTPPNGEAPRKLQPTAPEEAPKRGMPGMPSQSDNQSSADATQRALPREIPVRRSPGMPEEMVYHRSPIYFPWQTGYIMPKHTPLPEEPEHPAPSDTAITAPATAEHKQKGVEMPPPTPVSHIAEAQANAVPQQSATAQATKADSIADRLRFERYLQQSAEKPGEAHATMEKLLALTAEATKSEVVTEARHLLVGLKNDDTAISLIHAIDSVRDARHTNVARREENAQMQQQIDELTATNNSLLNRNSARQKKAAGQRGNSNVVLMAHNNHTISRLRAKIHENEALISSTAADARSSYEAYVAQLLAQGFYDHATIGARLCRHLFRDEGIGTGENPAARALQHRESVDKRMQAVNTMLQENRLVGANEALEHAYREGEHMFSVREFPTAERRRIANFRSWQKRLQSAMKAKDYNAAERAIARLSAMSSDCEVARELSLCAQKKAESDMYLREGAKALKRRDEAAYTTAWKKAAEIWPMNPNLDASLRQAEKLDRTRPHYD